VSAIHGHSFDAERIRRGTFHYSLIQPDKPATSCELSVARGVDGAFVFSAEFPSLGQHWRSVARPDLAPISAALTQDRGAVSTGFDLRYTDGEVTGTQSALDGDLTTSPVRARVPDDTIDQRVDWAAVLACELRIGEAFTFHVFDPGGGISLVRAEVMSLETVRVPLGEFETVRVVYEVGDSAEPDRFEVWVTPEPPRMLVREVFPWGLTTDLEAIKEP
jgi:Protein of unknown function (DUF3108)